VDRIDGRLVVSASDLVDHLACGHLTALDRALLDGRIAAPPADDPEVEVVRRRGLEHEERYLEARRDGATRVVEVPVAPPGVDGRLGALRAREACTVEAMRSGADVVYQATFIDERGSVWWRGHADFLERVEGPTALGAHGYEPVDTKLARHVRPSAVLQLCEYAAQVARIQGRPPEHVHVVLGGDERVSVRLVEVAAYARRARQRFLVALAAHTDPGPEPCGHCAVCRWWPVCDERWERDDHLSRVAGLSREQARRFVAAGVPTLTALARSGSGLVVRGVGPATVPRLQQQARLQLARPPGGLPPFEVVTPVEADRGLATLPEPDPGDLFYDIEGDPYVGPHGIEYLHGVGWVDDDGTFRYERFWAHDAAAERRAFEDLIDLIVARRRRFPGLHVYHYAAYERTALGRLMGRYGTREAELDDLLRDEVFVDLYRAVRQGVVIGSPSYSLKKLEPLYMPPRTGEITDAGSSIVEYERWLESGDGVILDAIEAYNRDDVESTWRLRDWLEGRRREAVDAGSSVPRQSPRAAAEPDALAPGALALAATDELAAELLAGRLDPPTADEPDDVRARYLMAHLLHWHQREAKPEWWRWFDRVLHCGEPELLADTEAIAGLEPVGAPVPCKQSLDWTYRFDPGQEHKLRAGSAVDDPAAEAVKHRGGTAPGPGTLVAVDRTAGTLVLRRGRGSTATHPRALIPSRPLANTAQRIALQDVAVALRDHGIDGGDRLAAARQLLARRRPRILGGPPGAP
jgi:uncharacterized protein